MLNYVLSLACCLLFACGGDVNEEADVPRNRSLIMNCTPPNTCAGQIQDYDSFNPFLPGSISSTGHSGLLACCLLFACGGDVKDETDATARS